MIKFLGHTSGYVITCSMISGTLSISKVKRFVNIFLLLIFLFYNISSSAENVITGGAHVRINSGIVVTMQQPVSIENGATLSNEGTLILKNNLSNENPDADLGKGTIEFSGTSVQNLSGQNTFGKLVINNPQVLNLLGNTTVNNELGLLNGLIRLGANNLTLGPQATLSGTPSATAMVIATGTGELRKSFSGKGTFTFPVGDESGAYTPVTLNFLNGKFDSENYAGITLKSMALPGYTGKGLNRYWSLTQNGISDFSYDVLFQYVPGDNNGKENELVCAKIDSETKITFNPSNTSLHQLTANGLNSFGTFTGIIDQQVGTELDLELPAFRCYPNPFIKQISIETSSIENEEITVEIYNLSGQLIKTLFEGTNEGKLSLKWDATDESGQRITPGIYLVKVNGQSKQLIYESIN